MRLRVMTSGSRCVGDARRIARTAAAVRGAVRGKRIHAGKLVRSAVSTLGSCRRGHGGTFAVRKIGGCGHGVTRTQGALRRCGGTKLRARGVRAHRRGGGGAVVDNLGGLTTSCLAIRTTLGMFGTMVGSARRANSLLEHRLSKVGFTVSRLDHSITSKG